jgi:hypothetical protein
VIKRPIEWWFLNDINQVAESCLSLHNMIVEVKIDQDELEDSNFYFCDEDETINERITDTVLEDIEQAQAELELIVQMDAAYYDGDSVNIAEMENDTKKPYFHSIINVV